jgi:hypothetical protein
MDGLKAANLGLAFLLEIAMLVALGFAGWAATPIWWLRYILLIGLPALAIVLWAVWAAPKSAKRLPPAGLVLFKTLIFGITTFLLWASMQPVAAAMFGGIAAVHLLLVVAFRQH